VRGTKTKWRVGVRKQVDERKRKREGRKNVEGGIE
jgi:hypothetical protein